MKKTIYTKGYKIFQRLLKQARKESKLTQVEVSLKIEQPQSYISKIEAGDRRIDVIEFWRLAKIYKRPVEFFFPFEEEISGKTSKKNYSLKVASPSWKK